MNCHDDDDLFFTIYTYPSLPPSVTAYDTDLNEIANLCSPSLPSNTVPISNKIRYTMETSRSEILPVGDWIMDPSEECSIAWPIWPGIASRSIPCSLDDGCCCWVTVGGGGVVTDGGIVADCTDIVIALLFYS